MKKISLQKNILSFKNGIIITFIGVVWMWLIFSDGITESDIISIDPQKSKTFDISLTGEGIAFYEIHIRNYQQNPLFVQILDPKDNIIAEQKVHTILSENFFDFNTKGNYVIRISNFSEENIEFSIRYGDTKLAELLIPEIITFVGSSILVYVIFLKMIRYSIAQPKDTISNT
ncbi:MAG TPA: hypothetical protein VLA01_00550 [Nitrosopumilaceae archaeon]|nr:hypothetical protein [Nitrosopumilaceae archaeon]